MSVEHWWNASDRGKLKDSEENLSQWHCIHHKSHLDCVGMEQVSPTWKTED